MPRISQLVPEGVKDTLVHDFEHKDQLLSMLKSLFKTRSYKQVETPIFEYYDLFSEMKGTLERDQMIKLIDTDGKILVLRPDATIPIARMVASNYQDVSSVLKFSYVTSIFRMNDDSQNVQSREFTQAGVELFGMDGSDADVEMIQLAIDSLKAAGIKQFTIDIGQANFYKALMEKINLPEEQIHIVEKLIETKNFAELDTIVQVLKISEEYKEAIKTIPALCGEPIKVLKEAEKIALNHHMEKEINQLKDVHEKLTALGLKHYLSFDLGLINHLNYYTGIVFQGYIAGFGKPVLLGGRYDDLTKHFGLDTKATGFAIYVDDLIAALTSKEDREDV